MGGRGSGGGRSGGGGGSASKGLHKEIDRISKGTFNNEKWESNYRFYNGLDDKNLLKAEQYTKKRYEKEVEKANALSELTNGGIYYKSVVRKAVKSKAYDPDKNLVEQAEKQYTKAYNYERNYRIVSKIVEKRGLKSQ